MHFSELKTQVKRIALHELRKDADNYFEAVIIGSKLNELASTLKEFLGRPVWPPRWRLKKKLSPQVKEAIKDFGGIMDGQTLYFYNRDHTVVFAMLWPWKDGEHTTVKIVKQ